MFCIELCFGQLKFGADLFAVAFGVCDFLFRVSELICQFRTHFRRLSVCTVERRFRFGLTPHRFRIVAFDAFACLFECFDLFPALHFC